jgi:tetratricopeptide (TPR) repeat protein
MAEAWPRTAPRPTATTPEFLATFGLILAAILAFGAFDVWLAHVDERESRQHAAHQYEDGRAQLAAGHPRAASDLFASAMASERTNVQYGTALGEALLAAGEYPEAESVLRTQLARAESDGQANLVLARVLEREGRADDAASYYHRAIYGRWEEGAPARRLEARMALVDLLARSGARQELLAELLPLADSTIGTRALRRRVAHLFVVAGAPDRAIAMFREMLRADAKDGDAYAGLGEAALEVGNFETARADLLESARLLGDTARTAVSLAVADSALALDPTLRRLDPPERRARAARVLALVLDAAARCTPAAPSAATDYARAKLAPVAPDSSQRAGTGRGDRTASRLATAREEAVSMIALASAIWDSRGGRCTTSPSAVGERALALVMAKLAD